MWWGVFGLFIASLSGIWLVRKAEYKREWQILKHNVERDHLKKGRWRRALTLRLFGHK